MYRKGLIIVFLLLLCAGRAMAYDFSVPIPGGNTLYFSYAEGGVAVVHPSTSAVPAQGWNGYSRPVGAVTIPSTVEHDGVEYNVVVVSDYAFFGCSNITSLTVGEGVEMLCASSFRGCSALTSVSLPSTMDTIGNYVFYGCADLQSVAVQSLVPPRCAAGAFFEVPLSNATLTVPNGSATAYGTMAPWSEFGTIVEAIYEVTLTAIPNHEHRGSVEGGGTYSAGSEVTLTATPANGFFFACWNDGDTLNPRVITVAEPCSFVAWFFAMQHDTLYLPVHDTVNVPVHDTLYVSVHDTLYVSVRDTLYLPVYDTVYVPDYDTLYVPVSDTLYVPEYDTVYDTVYVTEYDTVFVPVHDTVYVPVEDTTHLGVNAFALPAGADWTVSARGRSLTVRCGVGEAVRIFDMQGRCLMVHRTTAQATTMVLPAAGVYLVSVGATPAKRIVIE